MGIAGLASLLPPVLQLHHLSNQPDERDGQLREVHRVAIGKASPDAFEAAFALEHVLVLPGLEGPSLHPLPPPHSGEPEAADMR